MVRRTEAVATWCRSLGVVDVRGSLVSIDAMGCQVKIVELIRQRGGDYLLGQKGNRPSLRNEEQEALEVAQQSPSKKTDEAQLHPVLQATTADKGHVESKHARPG